MRIKCYHLNQRNISVQIDGVPISFETGADGNAVANLTLESGNHVLTIAKRSLYATPLCYLNILNPLFYLWQLRFYSLDWFASDESFAAMKLPFVIREKEDAALTLKFSQNRASAGSNLCRCAEWSGINRPVISGQYADPSQKRRWKIAHIGSSLFYMILLNIFMIVNCLDAKNAAETVVFCLLNTFFSCSMIYKIQKKPTPSSETSRKRKKTR